LVTIAIKFIAKDALINSRAESEMKQERLYLARVVSPGMAMTLFAGLFAIILSGPSHSFSIYWRSCYCDSVLLTLLGISRLAHTSLGRAASEV
jgi:hypothetical protein